MSVSIYMSSITKSEPRPASAHSPNSDQEIEVDVDYDNLPPIHECFQFKLHRTLNEKMGVN